MDRIALVITEHPYHAHRNAGKFLTLLSTPLVARGQRGMVAARIWAERRKRSQLLDLILFLKAVFAGFIVAVPIGAVGALCLRRSFQGRWFLAIVAGLGAAAADSVLAAAAVFGLSLVTHFLVDNTGPVRLVGGLFLVCLGAQMIRKREISLSDAPMPMSTELRSWWKMIRALSTGFVLTIVNPATFLAFVGVFAGFGLLDAHPLGGWADTLIVVGVFVGSLLWWTTLTVVASAVRRHAPLRIVAIVNSVLGLIVLVIGVAALVSFVRMAV
jgi:putative LysE/RhtB family amino acid efflux pump